MQEIGGKHFLAGLIHIMAGEYEKPLMAMPETETSTHGHVMVHKSDFRHFMLQFAPLYACYKMASGLESLPQYASLFLPYYGENRTRLYLLLHIYAAIIWMTNLARNYVEVQEAS